MQPMIDVPPAKDTTKMIFENKYNYKQSNDILQD